MKNENFFIKNYKNYLISRLNKKYSMKDNIFYIYLIDKIIYNEKCHSVAEFKDFLIYDDDFEFLKKYYILNHSLTILKLYFQYYEKYTKIFPNYSALPESKYIYINIHKKQKIIYEIIKFKKNINKDLIENNDIYNYDLFNSRIYNSILNFSENGCNSIFGLSKKEKKLDGEDNTSIFLINNIINNIENKEMNSQKQKEKEKKPIESNIKSKFYYFIKPINNVKKIYKIKGRNATINNFNISINIKNSNSLRNNNKEFIFNQRNSINTDKIIYKEKDSNKVLFYKLKSKKVFNNIKNNAIYPLNIISNAINSIKNLKKYNVQKKITIKKPTDIKLNIKNKINNTNSSINIKNINNINNNEKTKQLNKNKVIKMNKYYSLYNKDNKLNNFQNKNKLSYNDSNIDLIKSLSEKKINENNKKFKKIIKHNINNIKKNIINTKTPRTKKEDNKDKKEFNKNLFTSHLLNKRYNTNSNIQRGNCYSNINKKVINYKTNNSNFNNSSLINDKKNRLDKINSLNSEEKNKEKKLININSWKNISNSTINAYKNNRKSHHKKK